ncbi:mannose-1-phosphate guanylyltransferase/mannose-6-phosphate isomerase [Altererythrobacter atlanticus]|nr:mannose-1-phosphate guanylyltransferase/mannose-6-phosphate isomerase [Croceibacterium atlanticum]
MPLIGEKTLFEATLDRCSDRDLFAPPIIVTGAMHLSYVEEQSAAVAGTQVIVEPDARNTAAAIALAAARLPEDALMLVCPSDHYIGKKDAFLAAIRSAAELASEDWLVSFGITATSPETGFGYILRGEPVGAGFRIESFVEKPDQATAEQFLANGNYSWNGGIFLFRAGFLMQELEKYRPDIASAVSEAVAGGHEEGAQFHPDAEAFARIKGESIDYAVMENTDRAAVVPVSMGWSDIGNWQALRDAREGDEGGNRTRGPVEIVDCRNVLAETDGPRISIIGLENIAVVVDGNEVLVTTMEGAQKVGKLSGASNQ